jgi:hypothetical protein
MRNTFDGTKRGGPVKLFEPQVLIIILIITLIMAIPVWLFWKVFARTGMNPALAFLCLIPYVGPFIVLLMLAFGRWPLVDGAGQALSASPANQPSFIPPAPQAGAVAIPPAWLPDPTGQHRLRYWDGTSWTSSVDDGSADPAL